MDILLYALLAGIGVALVAGPLGSFVVWRRMAYFSDTLAHSALLGVALGLVLSLPIPLMVVILCATLAVLLLLLQINQTLSADTLLGILAHTSLALGLFIVSFIKDIRIDLMAYLFGDLLSVTAQDLAWIYGGGLCILMTLILFWDSLLAVTVHEELARIEGVPVERIKLTLMLMLALVVAVAMKIVGVLLISALLIIPAATVRRHSNSPETMAIAASLCGMVAVIFGLSMSYHWDSPAGPSVVVACFVLFIGSQLIPVKTPQ